MATGSALALGRGVDARRSSRALGAGPGIPDEAHPHDRAAFGLEAVSGTPEHFAAVIRSDAAKLSKIIQATGAKVN